MTSTRIRATTVDDSAVVRDFLEGLSTATAYRRFLTGIGHPSSTLVRAMVQSANGRRAFVAERDGVVIGHATSCRTADDAVELAVVVSDAWQHRGIGRALGDRALRDAHDRGATHAQMSVHAANDDVIEIVQHLWPEAEMHEHDGLLVYDIGLAA